MKNVIELNFIRLLEERLIMKSYATSLRTLVLVLTGTSLFSFSLSLNYLIFEANKKASDIKNQTFPSFPYP